jgi:hypothetical protein
MARFPIPTAAVAALMLSACGGSSSSTGPGNVAGQGAAGVADVVPAPGIHWSNCGPHLYGMSTSGISCHAAQGFVDEKAMGKAPTKGARHHYVPKSAPRNFTAGGYSCTQFPVPEDFGWHYLCSRANQHISFYISP